MRSFPIRPAAKISLVAGGALQSNTTGYSNTATGLDALFANTDGSENMASGFLALYINTTGLRNTASGAWSLYSNTTGSHNTALGYQAGYMLTTGDNNIDIGYSVGGVAGESNTIRIGNTDVTDTFIRRISGATAPGGAAVFVNSDGRLGTMTSSARFKEEIKPIGKASEAILTLRPVSFRYRKEIDPQAIPEFGLVAEEVAEINPELVTRDAKGELSTVRYEAVNAMLLNEFLKEHRKAEKLECSVSKHEETIAQQQKEFEAITAQQQKEIRALRASLIEQAAQVRKVGAQLEMSKTAPKT